jgi:hypothetical protein
MARRGLRDQCLRSRLNVQCSMAPLPTLNFEAGTLNRHPRASCLQLCCAESLVVKLLSRLPQLFCRIDVQLEPPTVLLDHNPVLATRGFE